MPYSFSEDYARQLAESIRRTARDREYIKWALQARKQYVDLRLKQDPEIRGLYLRAAKRAGELVKSHFRWPSDILLRRRLSQLETGLEEIAQQFNGEFTGALKTHIVKTVTAGTGYSQAVVLSLAKTAGWNSAPIHELFAQVNQQAVEACWARTRKGLFLSDRIWQTAQTVRDAMQEIIQAGIATGMDAVQVARAVERYVNDGQQTLAQHYPNMMKRLKGRVPKNLTYEGLRLARTEATAAFGEGTIAASRVSPSYRGMKWILSKAHPLPDVCEDLAERDDFGLGPGVYAIGNEPMYPAHPNCLCVLVPIHETPEEFVERLRRWREAPDNEPKLEQWYNEIYREASVPARLLRFPVGVGARVDPELIRARYAPEQVLETIRASSWKSDKDLKVEHQKHASQWAKYTGITLDMDQFKELQEVLLVSPEAGIYYYVHPRAGANIAVYAEKLRYLGKVFPKVGLIYSIDRGERTGFWMINKGLRYFQERSDFVEIRRVGGRKSR